MKRTQFKRKTSFKRTVEGSKLNAKPSKMSKTIKQLSPYKKRKRNEILGLDKFLKAIPESQAHGSGTHEKRLWRLLSDYIRIRDWYKYNGKCVATGIWIPSWNLGQAGHYISYTSCNNMFKFDEKNIHMQKASSNMMGSMSDGKRFGDELERRYGAGTCDFLHSLNEDEKDLFYAKEDVVEKIKRLLKDFQELEEIPDYVRRAYSLLVDNSIE